MKILQYFRIIIFSLALILVLTAFGCKQSDQESAGSTSEDSNEAQEQVTYNAAEIEEVINNGPSEDTSSQEEQSEDTETDSATSKDNQAASEEESTDNEDQTLLTQAEKLAEIYGTYTNKDKESFKNLKDLEQYATDDLQKWINNTSQGTIDKNAPFYGVTTKSLSSTVLKKGSNTREIIVTVKKEEITATSNTPKVSYKVILMLFEKSGEDWKLDGIYWQE